MGGVPLHPAMAHVPLGVAMVIPILALWALVGTWREEEGPRWGMVSVLLVVVVALGFFTMSLGKQDEEKVERVVPEEAIEAHEEAGTRFVWSGVVALVLSVVALAASPRVARGVALAAAAATLVTAGFGMLAGKLGGELVYKHGAASAHVEAARGATPDAAGAPGRHDDD